MVPPVQGGDFVLPTQAGNAARVQVQMLPKAQLQPEQTGGQRPQNIAVGKAQHMPVALLIPLPEQFIATRADGFRAFATRGATPENVPRRNSSANLRCRQPLVAAIAPLTESGAQFRDGVTRKKGGAEGAQHRAGVNPVEGPISISGSRSACASFRPSAVNSTSVTDVCLPLLAHSVMPCRTRVMDSRFIRTSSIPRRMLDMVVSYKVLRLEPRDLPPPSLKVGVLPLQPPHRQPDSQKSDAYEYPSHPPPGIHQKNSGGEDHNPRPESKPHSRVCDGHRGRRGGSVQRPQSLLRCRQRECGHEHPRGETVPMAAQKKQGQPGSHAKQEAEDK